MEVFRSCCKILRFPSTKPRAGSAEAEQKQANDTPDTPFRLMDLPAELRVEIYSYYFGHSTVYLHYRRGMVIKKSPMHVAKDGCSKIDLALIYCNKQIYKEALDTFWDTTTVFLKLGTYLHGFIGQYPPPRMEPEGPPSFLGQSNASFFNNIQHVVFRIDATRPCCTHPTWECGPDGPGDHDHTSHLIHTIAAGGGLKTAELHFMLCRDSSEPSEYRLPREFGFLSSLKADRVRCASSCYKPTEESEWFVNRGRDFEAFLRKLGA